MIKKTIKVHTPTNEHTRYYRNYNLFWDELIEELKKKYNVITYGEWENAHADRTFPVLTHGTNQDLFLYDTDCIIENERGEFIMFTITDMIHANILMEKSNPKFKKAYISQYVPQNIESNVRDELLMHKYSPWIYFPTGTTNLEPYYYKRKHIKDFIDEMSFRGGTAHRPILSYISSEFVRSMDFLPLDEYFNDIIKYKVGLAVGGRGEFCYRDIEYMALGVPLLRFEYQSKMLAPLIPNYHYISVDVPDDMPRDRNRDGMPDDSQGLEHHARMLEQRFLEVKDDMDFLNFISRNARIYYETYLAPKQNVKYTISLIRDFLEA